MKLSLAAVLAAGAALLAGCGGSGAGLIPNGNAGPLRADFEAVANAAEEGNGNCAKTEAAIAKTRTDFGALPSSTSSRLRSRLSEGIAHLSTQALELCKQPGGGGTTTTLTEQASTSKTKSTPTSTTTTTTTTTASETEEEHLSSSTSSSSSSTQAVPPPVGGTEAPNGGVEANPGGSAPEEGVK